MVISMKYTKTREYKQKTLTLSFSGNYLSLQFNNAITDIDEIV